MSDMVNESNKKSAAKGADTFGPVGHETEEKPSLLQEIWQSMKYAAVQETYDGATQLVNHFGGDIAPRHLVDAPSAAEVGSSNWYAQQVGSGAVKFAGVLGTYKLLGAGNRLFGAGTASTFSLAEAGTSSLLRFSAAGALYDGVFTKSGDNFWQDRMANAATTGLTIYGLGKMHSGIRNVTGLGAVAGEGLGSLAIRQVGNSASGALSGAAGGAMSAELNSLLKEGRLATGAEVGESATTFAAFGGTLGLLSKPGQPSTKRSTGADARVYKEPLVSPAHAEGAVDYTMPQYSRLAGENPPVQGSRARHTFRPSENKAPDTGTPNKGSQD